jgi:hypothetical protein
VTIWKVGLPEGSTVMGKISLQLSCSNRTFSCAKVAPGATPVPTATPVAGVLDPDFGVIYWGVRTGFEKGSAPQVRREGETTALGELAPSYFNQFHGSVSPDGRRAAYFATGESGPQGLYLLDGSRPSEQRRLISIPGEISYSRPVWSADGTGVVFTVADEGATQGVRAKYAALRTLDIASGAVSEVARVEGGDSYGVVGWDRAGGTLAYVQQAHGEPAKTYIARTASGVRAWTIERPYAMSVSPDAREVAAVECTSSTACSVVTWKLGDFGTKTQRQLGSGLSVSVVGWRAASSELVLVLGGSDATSAKRVAVLSFTTGALRDVYQLGTRLPSAVFLRADGAAIIVTLADEIVVVDLASGKSSPLPLPTPREPYEVGRAAASIRLR